MTASCLLDLHLLGFIKILHYGHILLSFFFFFFRRKLFFFFFLCCLFYPSQLCTRSMAGDGLHTRDSIRSGVWIHIWATLSSTCITATLAEQSLPSISGASRCCLPPIVSGLRTTASNLANHWEKKKKKKNQSSRGKAAGKHHRWKAVVLKLISRPLTKSLTQQPQRGLAKVANW